MYDNMISSAQLSHFYVMNFPTKTARYDQGRGGPHRLSFEEDTSRLRLADTLPMSLSAAIYNLLRVLRIILYYQIRGQNANTPTTRDGVNHRYYTRLHL